MASVRPLVSCLTVTQAGRKDLLHAAVRQFEQQAYIPRELVIVTNAPQELPAFNNSAINVYPYPKGVQTLGDLRNLSVQRAQGALLAIWDDDDWRHPDYLAAQVACLGDWPLVMLQQIRLRCACGINVLSSQRAWECTMVVRQPVMIPYNSMDLREDTRLLRDLRVRGHIPGFNNQNNLYVKQFHNNNAWGAQHNARLFSLADPPHSCRALEAET